MAALLFVWLMLSIVRAMELRQTKDARKLLELIQSRLDSADV